MVMLTRTDDWTLTISYWPHAVLANVRPQRTARLCFDDDPALYAAHDIDFSYPPTRADFFAVVRMTPWMSTWEGDLLPIIASHAWPMIAVGFKGSTVDLRDDNGCHVGRLEVWRRQRHCNTPRPTLGLWTYPGSDVDRLIKRRICDGERRERAHEHVQRQRNLILERLADGQDQTEERMLREVERVLVEGGFVKPRRTARAKQGVVATEATAT
jgi:hypothetical protein